MRRSGGPSRIYVIAEAGVNHNGSVETAIALVRAASRAGANAVKFQAFRAEALASPRAPKAEYQSRESGADQSQLEMLRDLEFGEAEHQAVIEVGRELGIEVLSSAFDCDSLAMLVRLGVPVLKVPSGEITNLPYLRATAVAAAGRARKVIVSTGMAALTEVVAAFRVLEDGGVAREDITLLHCTTEYPAPPEDVNLLAMVTLRESFGVAVGYSDHTEGIAVPTAAAALGAAVIEKHLTLDRRLPGPDHRASLEPPQFGAMVDAIRAIESALGDGIKKPTPMELVNRVVVRKSIVASKAIVAGERFCRDNITTRRPATGISPMRWDEVVGAAAPHDFEPDDEVEL